MKKMIKKYKSEYNIYNQIINENTELVKEDNKQVMEELFFAGVFIFTVFFFINLIIEPERYLFIGLGLASLLCYFMTKNLDRVLKKLDIVTVQYTLLLVTYIMAIQIAIITNPSNYAVVLPVFFALAPILFIEKLKHSIVFFLALNLIANILIFQYKSDISLCIRDSLNCTVFAAFGLAIGNAVNNSRLSSIQLNEELKHRENTDFLTNLPNRRMLFEQFGNDVDFHGILMLDIDDFKKYNDTYGHHQGDQALKAFANCLMEMGTENLEFIRYGGEEFLGIYRGTSLEELTEISHKLNANVRKLNIAHTATPRGYMTVSVGYYFSETPICDEIVISYADVALYEAKAKGKDGKV